MSITESINDITNPQQCEILPLMPIENLNKHQQTSIPIQLGMPDELLTDIVEFKTDIITWAKNKLTSEGSLLETKEAKDLVGIIDTIEKSVKPNTNEKPTVHVNVLVQNLMDAKDDC